MNEIILLDRSGLLGSKVGAQDKSSYATYGNNLMIEAGNVTNGFTSVNGRRSLGMKNFQGNDL